MPVVFCGTCGGASPLPIGSRHPGCSGIVRSTDGLRPVTYVCLRVSRRHGVWELCRHETYLREHSPGSWVPDGPIPSPPAACQSVEAEFIGAAEAKAILAEQGVTEVRQDHDSGDFWGYAPRPNERVQS